MTKEQELIALKKLRGDWGMIKPCMRVERDKKKYNRKEKHKVRYC